MLPDNVLLAIFDINAVEMYGEKGDVEAWQTLVHVCRRWRCLVFGSSSRLNLRLVCTPKTPARECLDVWPALPLVIEGIISSTPADNIIVALGHSDRVCQIELKITGVTQWDEILAAMQVPFPALTDLELRCDNQPEPVIPNSFLGGSVPPRLEYLQVDYTPFPEIPNLLLTCTHLTELHLCWLSDSAYISPEAMATCLSMLTSLRNLFLTFRSSGSRSDREGQRTPPMTPFILPELVLIRFEVASEYLEDLIARIDAPRLGYLHIHFHEEIDFHAPLAHLVQFISRTPKFQELNLVSVNLDPYAEFAFMGGGRARVGFSCDKTDDPDPQVSYVAQICTMCLPPLLTVENFKFDVYEVYPKLDWINDVENGQWLELLRPFTAVKNLYLSEEFQSKIASALQELVGGRTMEVLPSLQNIFFQRSEPPQIFQETIGRFVAARQLSGHPVAISV